MFGISTFRDCLFVTLFRHYVAVSDDSGGGGDYVPVEVVSPALLLLC
jgi:hypothetical protein